jgi:steroid delta-isomerase-like uncharacterized protein
LAQDASTQAEANAALVRRWVDVVWNEGNVDAVDEFAAPEYVLHSPGEPEPIRGLPAYKDFVAKLRAGFPDLRVEVHDVFATEDRAAIRYTAHGTHTASYRGLPATGTRFAVSQIIVARLADGKVAEAWQELDALGLMRQFGAVPPEGSGPLGLIRWTFATIARFARLEVKARRK